MRLRVLLWSVVLLGVGALSAAAQNRFILRPTPTASVNDIVGRHGLTLVGPLDNQNRGIYLVTAPPSETIQQVETEVGADVEVTDIEPDATMAITENPGSLSQSSVAILDDYPTPTSVSYYGVPVLGLYLSQQATTLIRLTDTQTTFGTTGSGIVAIIDTGVDPNHSVLTRSLVPGYDFVNNIAGSGSEMIDLTPANLNALSKSSANAASKTRQVKVNQSSVAILDQSSVAILDTKHLPSAFGHGTMVAGVVHLVAPTAKIMPLKAFQGDGTAALSNILRAIYYAADSGARVINMSFSLLAPSVELDDAIEYAETKEVIMVASTGNTGTGSVANPAAMSKVIGVASTSNADRRSTFSSYGPGTFVAAPGEQVITLYPGNNYAVASGTSFSAPMVAGASALDLQVNPLADYSDATKAVSHAKQLTSDLGAGRLDLYQAIQFAMQSTGD